MVFEGLMRDLVGVPGWHLSLDRRVPFLVVPNSKNFKDSYPQFNRNDFPYRTTIILKDHIWEMVEFSEESKMRTRFLNVKESKPRWSLSPTKMHRMSMQSARSTQELMIHFFNPFFNDVPKPKNIDVTRATRIWMVWEDFGRWSL